MNKIVDTLIEALGTFEQETKPISERDVSKAIYSVRASEDPSEPPMQWVAEAMAFDFFEGYHDQTTGRGTYYKPMFVLKNGDGTATEALSIKSVTEQIIKYWTERAKTAKHPVLRARYADLVWDFSKVVINKSPHYSIAQIVIDSIIEIAQRNCCAPQINVIRKLKRALSLAIALKDNLFENDKVKLTGDQKQKLLDDLEGHLLRTSQSTNEEKIDPWAVEAAALRLAKYYRKIGRDEDTKRVIVAIGDAFIQASSKASALQTSAWLQRVHATYKEFGLSDKAEEISIKLREVGEKTKSELKSISHTIEVPKEKMDKYIAALTEGELDHVLMRITAHYIPKKSEVEKQLKELASEAPSTFLFPRELLDNMGRPLAKVGSLEEDLAGHTVMQMSQNMVIESIFLRQALESLVNKYPTFENLYVDYLFRSPVFEEDRKPIIGLGVQEYINGKHMASVHLLIPQIEKALRVLLENAGGAVLKQARDGGFHYKVLKDLLHDPFLLQFFGEDIVFYFRALLVDQRGWNLRNCVCHGLYNASEFGPSMSDRIIHVLLCLALVRESE